MSANYSDDLRLAKLLTGRADKITSRWYRSSQLRVDSKSDSTPVTQADKEVELMIRKVISEERPQDIVYGEEFGGEENGHRRWIIDPIDGTKNFAHGNPVYATLIALEEDGKLVLSVVSAPQLNKRWWATLGSGSWSNGVKIGVSTTPKVSNCFISFGSISWWEATNSLDNLMLLIRTSARQRSFGDFWQHMLVAEGSIDIALEQGGGVKIWDMSAPKLIVQEAGGTVTTIAGGNENYGTMVSTNGLVHQEVLTLLNKKLS